MKAFINVPETLNDVTLKQYQHFMKVSQEIEGDFLNQKTIEIFCGVRLVDVLAIQRKSLNEIISHLSALFQSKYPLISRFKIKNQEFGMIPNLDAITQGEYADLDTYINDWDNMHKAMAVLFRPIKISQKDKYTIIDYQGTDEFAELMKFMPLDVVLGAVVFFYRLGIELLKSTQTSLLNQSIEMEKATTRRRGSSVKDGDGITVFSPLLKETLDDSMKYLESLLENVLPTYPTLRTKKKQNANTTTNN